MKRNKKYTPKRINPNFMRVIEGVKPLTESDKQHLFKTAIKSINAITFHVNLSTSDFTVLSDMVNISLLLTEIGIGREHIEELYEAREALQDTKQRYITTKRLVFKANDIKAVKVALTIHQAQIDICTLAEFTNAFEEQEKRVRAGNFYKRDGDLPFKPLTTSEVLP